MSYFTATFVLSWAGRVSARGRVTRQPNPALWLAFGSQNLPAVTELFVGFRLAAGGVGGAFHLMTRGDHRYLGKESLKVVGS